MQSNDALVVPFFKTTAIENAEASRREGRPVYDDVEIVEIRIAGDRNFMAVVPAHSFSDAVDGFPRTYAERWPEEYARFKAGHEQVASGTPLSELPFLTEAKRQELRALKVYTAEALASLDGKNLSALGINGREWKEQATAYLDRAKGSARDVALAAEVEALRARIVELQGEQIAAPDDDEKNRIKAEIRELTGSAPRGNPSVDTLRDMLADLKQSA